jgi:hypothetical protein
VSGLYDLGFAAAPGENQLTTDTGFALLDGRATSLSPVPSRERVHGPAPVLAVQAVGTTLNGCSYSGQVIVGPAELRPDYKLLVDSVVSFEVQRRSGPAPRTSRPACSSAARASCRAGRRRSYQYRRPCRQHPRRTAVGQWQIVGEAKGVAHVLRGRDGA